MRLDQIVAWAEASGITVDDHEQEVAVTTFARLVAEHERRQALEDAAKECQAYAVECGIEATVAGDEHLFEKWAAKQFAADICAEAICRLKSEQVSAT